AGAVAAVDPEGPALRWQTEVCPAPRGIDLDDGAGLLRIACASGELVALRPEDGSLMSSVFVAPDLRDVVVSDGRIFASTFRTAERIEVDAAGGIVERLRP